MNILNIKGLHLEVMPFKKDNIELHRLCFNCEVSIVVDYEKLKEITEQIFIDALDKQWESTIQSSRGINKTDFFIVVSSDENEIKIIIRTNSKIRHPYFNEYIYTISKSDNKEINKFRKKIGDWI